MSGNKKSMNTLFGKSRVKNATPDSRWALPSELIGIEIEVENFERDNDEAAMELYPEWVMHSDGSLRNGVEWVLSGPLAGSSLHTAIDKFFDRNYRYTMSERTSVHLHVNASDDLSVDQFRNIFTVMYFIEPAVFRWADENRKWCGYCQPLTDFAPHRLAQILADSTDVSFVKAIRGQSNQDRYYGLNVAAFHKHGTVEFRYFPCTNSKATMISWIQFVMEVKRAALSYESPAHMLSAVNTESKLRAFISAHFPSCAVRLTDTLDFMDSLKRIDQLSALVETDTTMVTGTDRHRPGNSSSKGYLKMVNKVFGSKPKKEDALMEALQAAKQQAAIEDGMATLRSRRAAEANRAARQVGSISNMEWVYSDEAPTVRVAAPTSYADYRRVLDGLRNTTVATAAPSRTQRSTPDTSWDVNPFRPV